MLVSAVPVLLVTTMLKVECWPMVADPTRLVVIVIPEAVVVAASAGMAVNAAPASSAQAISDRVARSLRGN